MATHRTIDTIDRVGGKIWHRALGLLLCIPLMIAAWGTVYSIQAGQLTGAAIMGVVTLCALFLVRHLFSSQRRLSDIDGI
jgi:cobalamin biosynthesis protein CobD/CbiB